MGGGWVKSDFSVSLCPFSFGHTETQTQKWTQSLTIIYNNSCKISDDRRRDNVPIVPRPFGIGTNVYQVEGWSQVLRLEKFSSWVSEEIDRMIV